MTWPVDPCCPGAQRTGHCPGLAGGRGHPWGGAGGGGGGGRGEEEELGEELEGELGWGGDWGRSWRGGRGAGGGGLKREGGGGGGVKKKEYKICPITFMWLSLTLPEYLGNLPIIQSLSKCARQIWPLFMSI